RRPGVGGGSWGKQRRHSASTSAASARRNGRTSPRGPSVARGRAADRGCIMGDRNELVHELRKPGKRRETVEVQIGERNGDVERALDRGEKVDELKRVEETALQQFGVRRGRWHVKAPGEYRLEPCDDL